MIVEDDGVTDEPFEVKVKLVVKDGRVIADFTGSSPQVRGPMNCTFVVAASALYNAIFQHRRSRTISFRATPAATAQRRSSRRRGRW